MIVLVGAVRIGKVWCQERRIDPSTTRTVSPVGIGVRGLRPGRLVFLHDWHRGLSTKQQLKLLHEVDVLKAINPEMNVEYF